MSLAYEAMMFAREVHKDQRRKYTYNPYTDHLAEVAGIVAAAGVDVAGPFDAVHGREVAIAVAWLHDCVEDQNISLQEIEDRFGVLVAIGVSGLSDLEKGNRAERKAAGRARLALCAPWIQTIKCADLISNTSSIVRHDPKFAVTYLEEKRLLLDVLTKADPRLLALAKAQADEKRGFVMAAIVHPTTRQKRDA
jgi:GTP diphosphokinase / guanosine-3',5'-bis(diphosphate) 3'-diphosphatase